MTREQVLPITRAPKPKPARPWRSGFCSPGSAHESCRGVFVGAAAGKDAVCRCDCHETSEAVAPPLAAASELTPGSPEWTRRITASKVAAILGVSPWESPRSMWHKMHGDLPREDANESQRRGNYLEPAILAWWRDQHDVPDHWWEPQPSFTLGDWAAATPDAQAIPKAGAEPVLIEAKSAAYDDDWGDPGTDVIPAYYLVQVQWQMHVSGVHRCYVPVLTSRLRFVEYVVDYLPEYGPALEDRMRAFYDSLSADEPPPLDDSVATFNAIRRVNRDIERGESVEIPFADAIRLVMSKRERETWEADERLAKSTVLDRMQRAQYATHNGVRIARRQPRGDDVTFVVTAKPSDLMEEPV